MFNFLQQEKVDIMRSVRQPPMRQGSCDDFQTPIIALKSLIPFIKKNRVIWECACGKKNLSNGLIMNGFSVIATDIIYGFDFLKWCPENFDCIVTNPPFSLKQEFLQRCYSLGKPFALLLPLTTFETRKRQELFLKYGLQVIFLDKRVNFETPSGMGGGAWFASAGFTWGLNLPKDIFFSQI